MTPRDWHDARIVILQRDHKPVLLEPQEMGGERHHAWIANPAQNSLNGCLSHARLTLELSIDQDQTDRSRDVQGDLLAARSLYMDASWICR